MEECESWVLGGEAGSGLVSLHEKMYFLRHTGLLISVQRFKIEHDFPEVYVGFSALRGITSVAVSVPTYWHSVLAFRSERIKLYYGKDSAMRDVYTRPPVEP